MPRITNKAPRVYTENVYLTTSLHWRDKDTVEALAHAEGVTISKWIRHVIERELERRRTP